MTRSQCHYDNLAQKEKHVNKILKESYQMPACASYFIGAKKIKSSAKRSFIVILVAAQRLELRTLRV